MNSNLTERFIFVLSKSDRRLLRTMARAEARSESSLLRFLIREHAARKTSNVIRESMS